MRHFILVIVFLAMCSSVFGQDKQYFTYDGIERFYYIHVPEDLPPNAPLVLMLHGYSSGARLIRGYSGMSTLADEHKFVVAYPQGTDDETGTSHWNANFYFSEVDDVGFLVALAQHLQATYQLNPQHTFSAGMSNGGFMSYTLACERPDVFKAIGSVTGTMSGYDWENCDPSEVVPVIQISGMADQTVPFAGIPKDAAGWGGAPGTIAVSEFWQAKNQTTTVETTRFSEVLTAEYYRNGINGNEVWLYPIADWGHTWPYPFTIDDTGISASEEIWKLFELVVNRNVVAIEKPHLGALEVVFPPLSGGFIEVNHIQQATPYQVYDILGRRQLQGVLTADNARISLQALPANLYFLRIGGEVFKFLN